MSQYDFSLKQEVLLEKGAAILADLFWFNGGKELEQGTPIAVLYELVWKAKRRVISSKSETDLVQIEAQFDLARQFLTEMEVGAHA